MIFYQFRDGAPSKAWCFFQGEQGHSGFCRLLLLQGVMQKNLYFGFAKDADWLQLRARNRNCINLARCPLFRGGRSGYGRGTLGR